MYALPPGMPMLMTPALPMPPPMATPWAQHPQNAYGHSIPRVASQPNMFERPFELQSEWHSPQPAPPMRQRQRQSPPQQQSDRHQFNRQPFQQQQRVNSAESRRTSWGSRPPLSPSPTSADLTRFEQLSAGATSLTLLFSPFEMLQINWDFVSRRLANQLQCTC